MKFMKNTPNYILAIIAIATLSACGDSFVIYKDGREYSSTSNTKTEDLNTPVSIKVNAVGLDDDWTQKRSIWKDEDFTIYGLRLPNYSNGASANWGSELDRLPECDGALIRFATNGEGTFKEGTHHYNGVNPEWRYMFTAASIGTADCEENFYGSNVILRNITLHGDHDIMIGTSYASEEEIDADIRKNRTGSYSSSPSFKLLATYRSDLYHSNISGYRNIHPRLHLKKLLTKFDVNVRGRFGAATPKDSLFRNIIITGIELSAPTKGTLMVANSKWVNEAFFLSSFSSGEIFTPTSEPSYIPANILAQTGLTNKQKADYNNFYLPQMQTYFTDNGLPFDIDEARLWWHVNTLDYRPIVRNMYIPRCDLYALHIHYVYVNRVVDDRHCFTDLLQTGAEIYDLRDCASEVETYHLQLPAGTTFQWGGSYTINIDAYSLERFVVTVNADPQN